MDERFSLKHIQLFQRLDDTALERVMAALKPRSYRADEVLFQKGDPGDTLLVVGQGQVAIYEPLKGSIEKEKPLRIFNPGEVLGEMALIDQAPRSLSARALQDSVVLELGKDDFLNLISENPTLGLSVMSGLSERVRYTTNFLNQVRHWLGKVGAGDYTTDELMVDEDGVEDATLTALVVDFVKMATAVKEREDILRQQVKQLQIQIDEGKRKQDVEEVMSTDYYKHIKEQMAVLRAARDEE